MLPNPVEDLFSLQQPVAHTSNKIKYQIVDSLHVAAGHSLLLASTAPFQQHGQFSDINMVCISKKMTAIGSSA